MQKILLIGSAPNALYYKIGTIIDSFDGLIVRFNAVKVRGFEDFIGSRTDVLALWNINIEVSENNNKIGNSWISEEKFLKQTSPKEILICGNPGEKTKQNIVSAGERFKIPVLEIPRNYMNETSKQLKEIKKNSKELGGTKPSNGLIAAYHYLKDKNNLVFYHGFSHFNRAEDLHYYHKGQWHEESHDFKSHTPSFEEIWFKKRCEDSNLEKFIQLPGL